jgi:AcrR family transcriptional regulator
MSQQEPGARQQILNAAIRVLREEGLEKLSQTRVAKSAGLRQGHLTYYFPKKADLWAAVAQQAEESLREDLSNFLASDGWPGADASQRAQVTAMVTYLVEDRQRARIMMSLALKTHEDPRLKEIFLHNISRTRDLITQAFSQVKDPKVIELILTCFWGLGIRHMIYQDLPEAEVTGELVSTLFQIMDEVGSK